MIVREILQRSATWLSGKGSESARLEAELLLAHVLGTERLGLYARAGELLAEAELESYRGLLRRRAAGEPVAYLTGRREFYGLEFEVTTDVLVPRPETELIVDRARELRPDRLLDVGTGSGCIAIACAKRLPDASVVATDVSAAALAVARRNARRHEAAVRFLEGSLFGPLGEGERFDLIVSNPPYVEQGHDPAREPPVALLAGPDGLDVIGPLLDGAGAHLAEGGSLLVEIGEEQEEGVRALAAGRFERIEVHRDLAGLPRMLEAS